ncbi:MAG: zf-HC2 domain-containing protein [Phycisphaerales bacterium]|nr:zf-HC2 domain-containing protein [Phycisphaerales bacterium]
MTEGNCDRWHELLVDDAAGELDASRRAELSSHLGECATCRETARSLSAVHDSVARAAGSHADALAATRHLPAPVVVHSTRWVWAAAAAVALAFTGGYALRGDHAGPGPGKDQPATAPLGRGVADRYVELSARRASLSPLARAMISAAR